MKNDTHPVISYGHTHRKADYKNHKKVNCMSINKIKYKTINIQNKWITSCMGECVYINLTSRNQLQLILKNP